MSDGCKPMPMTQPTDNDVGPTRWVKRRPKAAIVQYLTSKSTASRKAAASLLVQTPDVESSGRLHEGFASRLLSQRLTADGPGIALIGWSPGLDIDAIQGR